MRRVGYRGGMEAATPHQSAHACQWAAPNAALAAALVGGVMHAQGFAALIDPAKHAPKPWSAVELDRWEPQIRAALARGDMTMAEVREGVALGWFQPWSFGQAIMITEMVLSPRMRALHVLVAAGDLDEICEMTPALEELARQAGCNFVGATGRKGWLRVLKRFGYGPAALQTVEKAL